MALARQASSGRKHKILAEIQLILRNIGKAMQTVNKLKRKNLVRVRELLLFMKNKKVVDREALVKLSRKL